MMKLLALSLMVAAMTGCAVGGSDDDAKTDNDNDTEEAAPPAPPPVPATPAVRPLKTRHD